MFPALNGLGRPKVTSGVAAHSTLQKPRELSDKVPKRPAAPAASNGPAPRTRALAAVADGLPQLRAQLERGEDALSLARDRRLADVAACPFRPGWQRQVDVAAVLAAPSRSPVDLCGGAAEKCPVCGVHHLHVALAVGGRILHGGASPTNASRVELYGGHPSSYLVRLESLLQQSWFQEPLRRHFDAGNSVDNLQRRSGMDEHSQFLLHINKCLFAHNPRWNVLQEQEGWRQRRNGAARSLYATLHDARVCVSYSQQMASVHDQRTLWPRQKALFLMSNARGLTGAQLGSDNCQLESISSLEGNHGAGTKRFVRVMKKQGVEEALLTLEPSILSPSAQPAPTTDASAVDEHNVTSVSLRQYDQAPRDPSSMLSPVGRTSNLVTRLNTGWFTNRLLALPPIRSRRLPAVDRNGSTVSEQLAQSKRQRDMTNAQQFHAGSLQAPRPHSGVCANRARLAGLLLHQQPCASREQQLETFAIMRAMLAVAAKESEETSRKIITVCGGDSSTFNHNTRYVKWLGDHYDSTRKVSDTSDIFLVNDDWHLVQGAAGKMSGIGEDNGVFSAVFTLLLHRLHSGDVANLDKQSRVGHYADTAYHMLLFRNTWQQGGLGGDLAQRYGAQWDAPDMVYLRTLLDEIVPVLTSALARLALNEQDDRLVCQLELLRVLNMLHNTTLLSAHTRMLASLEQDTDPLFPQQSKSLRMSAPSAYATLHANPSGAFSSVFVEDANLIAALAANHDRRTNAGGVDAANDALSCMGQIAACLDNLNTLVPGIAPEGDRVVFPQMEKLEMRAVDPAKGLIAKQTLLDCFKLASTRTGQLKMRASGKTLDTELLSTGATAVEFTVTISALPYSGNDSATGLGFSYNALRDAWAVASMPAAPTVKAGLSELFRLEISDLVLAIKIGKKGEFRPFTHADGVAKALPQVMQEAVQSHHQFTLKILTGSLRTVKLVPTDMMMSPVFGPIPDLDRRSLNTAPDVAQFIKGVQAYLDRLNTDAGHSESFESKLQIYLSQPRLDQFPAFIDSNTAREEFDEYVNHCERLRALSLTAFADEFLAVTQAGEELEHWWRKLQSEVSVRSIEERMVYFTGYSSVYVQRFLETRHA